MNHIISPNMLKIFKQCPKKYYLKYVKKLPMPVDGEIFMTGQNIHALASYYLRGENIDNMVLSLSDKEKALWNYLKSTEYFKYNTVQTEYTLSVKVGNHFFGGRLDALVKNNNIYYILDYKTGSAPKEAEYDFQTIIYTLAVKDFFKTDNIKFVYIDLKNKKEVCIELSQKLVQEYLKILMETAQKIDKSGFSATAEGCKSCEYGVVCYDKKLSD